MVQLLLDEAVKVRDDWEEHNWSIGYLEKIKEEYGYFSYNATGEKWIYLTNLNRYTISKYVPDTGKQECYGTFDTLEEAVEERDKCIACNWDWDLICDCGL